ncbi:MAG: hypothetical protein ACE5GQ_04570 [Nitrospinales bacterium]
MTLLNVDKHPQSFEIQFELSDLNLPPEALVFVEAYKRTSYMRFPFGTIGQRAIPSNRNLVDIEPGVIPLFRVKVVDRASQQGRIIALADKILPRGVDAGTREKISLLHVEFAEDLGGQIWRLDLSGGWPVLQVNNQIDLIKEIAKSDPAFTALVYPEVVRKILSHIIESDEIDPELDEEDWPGMWLSFVGNMPGIGSPPSGRDASTKNDQKDWIESAVKAFSDKWRLLDEYQKLHDQGQE